LSASTATLATSITTLSNTVTTLDQRVNTNYNSLTNLISVSTSSAVRWAVPVGIVSLWYGTIGNIPSGWALCDGNNSTPDLRDRFVVGAGNNYSVNQSGDSTAGTSGSAASVRSYYALAYIMKTS
jgi:Tfp pilus assembly protein FimT